MCENRNTLSNAEKNMRFSDHKSWSLCCFKVYDDGISLTSDYSHILEDGKEGTNGKESPCNENFV